MLIDANFDIEKNLCLKNYLSPKASPIGVSTTRVSSSNVCKSLIRQYVKSLRPVSINSINNLEFKFKFKALIYFGKSLFRSLSTLSSYK
jgi:hypothetical protein